MAAKAAAWGGRSAPGGSKAPPLAGGPGVALRVVEVHLHAPQHLRLVAEEALAGVDEQRPAERLVGPVQGVLERRLDAGGATVDRGGPEVPGGPPVGGGAGDA